MIWGQVWHKCSQPPGNGLVTVSIELVDTINRKRPVVSDYDDGATLTSRLWRRQRGTVVHNYRSPTNEWFGCGALVGGSTRGWRWRCKIFGITDLGRDFISVFQRHMKLDAAGLNLGLYPETKAIDWRRCLVLWWLQSVECRLERWQLTRSAQLWRGSFGWFSSDW